MSASLDPVEAIAKIANVVSQQEPHLPGGLSIHFSCLLKQVLLKLYGGVSDEEQGALIRGKEFHKYIQNLLRSGMKIRDTWVIIGHEQYVRYPDGSWDPRGRLSPIDTLVYNLITKQYEIWDWKTTHTNLLYVRLDPLYEAQANMYAQLRKAEWNLDYDPVCRVLIADTAAWSEMKGFSWVSRPSLFAESEEKIRIINQNAAQIKKLGVDKTPLDAFRALADGIHHWAGNKRDDYRKDCRYCDHKEKCVKFIQARVTADEIDTAEVVI